MKNYRYLVQQQFSAAELAADLKIQLEVNRFHNVSITAVDSRNELIVQMPEADGELEETVDSFMSGYQTGVILE